MHKNRGFLDLAVLKEVIQLSQNFLLCKHIKKRNKRNIKNKDNQTDTINKKTFALNTSNQYKKGFHDITKHTFFELQLVNDYYP